METRREIGGRSVQLHYTVGALCAMEDRAGGSLERIMERQFTAARLLLWGGMVNMQPETTLQMAGDMIDRHIEQGGTLDEIVEMCADALESAGFFRHESR